MALQAVLDTLELGLRIKKTPVVVGNCTGFAVNRVFFPYTMAACLLVDLGAEPYMIDKVIKGMFGMPMGPFRLSDLVRFPHYPCCVFHNEVCEYMGKCICVERPRVVAQSIPLSSQTELMIYH